MSYSIHLQSQVSVRRGVVRRRDFLRAIPAAALAAGVLGWQDAMIASTADVRRAGKACILLWMQGGPSQFETFDPKPGHANGGETQAISTSVSGIQIAQNLPLTAQMMIELCLLRSLTSKEGSHPRATYLMHTGYLPTATVKYPTLGSVVGKELGDPSSELPSFVRIGAQRFGDGAGLLGVDYDPLMIAAAGRPPENAALPSSPERYRRRLGLLSRLERDYAGRGGRDEVANHQKVYAAAARMILSPQMQAFDLSKEPQKARDAYGSGQFGQGCLLARRLIEAGVTFVEVNLGNWDTHQDNFNRNQTLCGQLDQPLAALLDDLKTRGLLESTLVVWMGEFGRTPRINPNAGRDHYPRAFCAALAGGGVKGGQVIGRTSAGGDSVEDRPISTSDLFRTVFHALGVDADKENMSAIGRPIKLVEGGSVVEEAFS
jgi:hypothetical protein